MSVNQSRDIESDLLLYKGIVNGTVLYYLNPLKNGKPPRNAIIQEVKSDLEFLIG